MFYKSVLKKFNHLSTIILTYLTYESVNRLILNNSGFSTLILFSTSLVLTSIGVLIFV